MVASLTRVLFPIVSAGTTCGNIPTYTPPSIRKGDSSSSNEPSNHLHKQHHQHQVVLDCALPGSPSRPNSLILRERAARAFALVCLCTGPTPASTAVVSGLVSLLRCREGEVVGGGATFALWALCQVPENRRAFAKTRCACHCVCKIFFLFC